MSAALIGKPKPHLKGKRRPKVAKKISAAWTTEMRAEAKARGIANAACREWINKIAASVSGPKNPRWKGGIAGQKYAPGFSKSLKLAIRTSDNFECQLCGKSETELGYKLSIHHADYDKSNHDELNLFSTCKGCNSRVNINRNVWTAHFRALAEVRCKFGQDVGKFIRRKVVTQREGFISIRDDSHPAGLESAFAAILAGLTDGS